MAGALDLHMVAAKFNAGPTVNTKSQEKEKWRIRIWSLGLATHISGLVFQIFDRPLMDMCW